MSLYMYCKIAGDILIGEWSESPFQHTHFAFFVGISFAYALGQSVFTYCQSACMQYFSLYATRKLHQDMINNIMKAPINLYFDTTPLGRILNKFSKDLNQLETDFGYNIGNVYIMFFSLMYSVIISIYSLAWLGFLIPFILLIGFMILKKA